MYTEVRKIIEKPYDFPKNILTTHIDQLHLLAKLLIEHETLSGQQIKNLLSDRSMNSEEEHCFSIKNDYGGTVNVKKLNQKEQLGNLKVEATV